MIGFLALNKPSGISSAKLLNKVKWCVKKQNKSTAIGHMGTLDPLANGVLVVAIGKATRLFNYFLDKTKIYKTTFKFGIETTSLDNAGEVVCEGRKLPTKAEIEKMLPNFVGEQQQVPPNFSAVKINGKCAYQRARNGETFCLAPKKIVVSKFEFLNQKSESEFEFLIECSSGTYVRGLARDLAKALDTCAIATKIERVSSGIFSLENALVESDITLENIEKSLISPIEALPWISHFSVSDAQFKNLLDGKKLPFNKCDGNYFVQNPKGDIMLAECHSNMLKILLNLKE